MATMNQLLQRQKMIEAKVNPLIEQRNDLALQVGVLETEMAKLATQIKAIQGVELFEINNEIAELARNAGAKTMSASKK